MATTSTTTPVTFDLAQEQQKLERRRRLLESMQGQLSTEAGGRMVGDRYVTAQPIGQVANLLSAFLAQKKLKQVDEDSSALSARYNSELSNGLSQYFSLKDGSPGVPMGPPTEGGEMGLVDERKPDPRKALLMALTSQLPPLQRMGEADLALQSKQGAEETFGQPQTVLGPDGKPQLQLFGNRGTQRPVAGVQPYEKPMTVGDRVVSPFAPEKPLADYSTKGGEQVTINGDLYQRMSDGMLRKLDNAPKTTVNVTPTSNTFIKGQKAGMEQWAKLAGSTVEELSKTARNSVKLLGTLNQLEKSDAAGVYSGPTANPAIWLSGLAASLGVPVDKAKLANSQTFEAGAISAWQDMIAAAGGNRGVVKEEAERIAGMVPQLIQSQQGRKQITTFLRQAAQQAVTDARKAQGEYAKALNADNPELFTFGLGEAMLPREGGLPAAPGSTAPAGSGQAIPLDQYLKQKQGGR